MLPNTMAWTLTAVPHHSGMSCSCLALHHHSCLTVLRGSYQSKCGGQPDGSSVPALSLIWELQMRRLQHPRHLRTIQSQQGHTTIIEANPVATRIRLSMRCLYVLARWFIQELKTLRARMLRERSEDTRLIKCSSTSRPRNSTNCTPQLGFRIFGEVLAQLQLHHSFVPYFLSFGRLHTTAGLSVWHWRRFLLRLNHPA